MNLGRVMKQKYIFGLFIVFLWIAPSTYALNSSQTGFDKPIITKIYHPQKSKTDNVSCYSYPHFAVVEYDSGSKGADYIQVRYKSNIITTNANALCDENFKGKRISLPKVDGYLEGVVDNYIFVKGPEPFGVLNSLTIYDAISGKKIFETKFNDDKGYAFTKHNQKISLTYYHPLKLNCLPYEHNLICWQKILKLNHISNDVKLSPPNCRQALKDMQKIIDQYNSSSKLNKPLKSTDFYDDPERSFQITAKVWIDDINKPKITYLNGVATCHLSP